MIFDLEAILTFYHQQETKQVSHEEINKVIFLT